MTSTSINKLNNSLTPTFKDFLIAPDNYYVFPSEIWEHILVYLNPIDIRNLMYTNKTFFKIVLMHSKSLTLKLKGKASTPEESVLFSINYYNNDSINNIINNRVIFINLMNIIYFAHTRAFEKIYNDNNIMPIGAQYALVNIALEQPISLYNASIRYGLIKAFSSDDIKMNSNILFLVKYMPCTTFNYLYPILLVFPSVISICTPFKYLRINNFFAGRLIFHEQNKLKQNLNTKTVLNHIRKAVYYGGNPENVLYILHSFDYSFENYIIALMCGVEEQLAYKYSYHSHTPNLFLTFKALVPIVGYNYAKMFILEDRYTFDEYPYFLEVASKMNSHNILDYQKCLLFSKTSGNVDKLVSLRDRKRKFSD